MKVLISGARGLIGQELTKLLEENGHEVFGLSRSSVQANFIRWSPNEGKIKPEELEGFDAVVHLAGENIASGRWSEALKKQIRESRLKGTELLVDTISKLEKKPKVFVGASAIGFYGDRKDEILNEGSDPGEGFLCTLCKDWEESANKLGDSGVRVVNARIGVVLSTKGGALSKMLTPFKLGLGGQVGNGKQYMSWISIKDVARAIMFLIENDSISGPCNLVAPNPVTNLEFTRAFGAAIKRPTIFPMPAFGAKAAFGEMAEELLLSSTRVNPKVLQDANFNFDHEYIEKAFPEILAD